MGRAPLCSERPDSCVCTCPTQARLAHGHPRHKAHTAVTRTRHVSAHGVTKLGTKMGRLSRREYTKRGTVHSQCLFQYMQPCVMLIEVDLHYIITTCMRCQLATSLNHMKASLTNGAESHSKAKGRSGLKEPRVALPFFFKRGHL